jgi:plastocyanin
MFAALHLQLAPILAAEKSKVPFYIVGGVLVLWALTLSLGIGMRNPNFPGSLKAQRIVMAISAVLVAATLTSAVLTSTAPPKNPPSIYAKRSTFTEGAPFPTTPAVITTSTTTTTPSEPPPVVATNGGHSLSLEANPTGLLAYNTKTLEAAAGKVTITFKNASPVEHNVTIAEGTKVLGATPTFKGGTRTLTLTLKPGKYVFYCSVPGHRQAGMEGTLTVTS